jgi:transmembrane sensor
VNVSVEHGLVLVRGAAVPGGQQRLGAGQALRAPTVLEPSAADPTRAALAVGAEQATSVREHSADLPPAEPIEDLPHEVASPFKRRVTAAHADGSNPAPSLERSLDATSPPEDATVPPQIDALLAEADRAREAGDFARSLQYFERVIATAPHFDPRRGLAAMSVARMTMGSNPARAAAALRATLDGMPAALQENANARLVEAYAKSGQSKSAQVAAERYLTRFPNGRRAEDVRRWAYR